MVDFSQRLKQLRIDKHLTQAQVAERVGVTASMEHWDELSFDDKRAVVDQLIVTIKATGDTCEIIWKF